eukprot:1096616-Rhodomonas_salina.1
MPTNLFVLDGTTANAPKKILPDPAGSVQELSRARPSVQLRSLKNYAVRLQFKLAQLLPKSAYS